MRDALVVILLDFFSIRHVFFSFAASHCCDRPISQSANLIVEFGITANLSLNNVQLV